MKKLKYLSTIYSDEATSKDVEELISAKENYWKGWSCTAGINNLYIDYDGNVFVCNNSSSKLDRFNYEGWEKRIVELKEKGIDLLTEEAHKSGLYKKHQRAFERSGRGFGNELDFYEPESFEQNWGFLGSIYQNFTINKKIVKCPYEQCGCGADIPITKASDPKYLKAFILGGISEVEKQVNKDDIKDGSLQLVTKRGGILPTILWDLGRRCNYDCSYCWPAVHNAKEEHKDIELLKKTCKKIMDELAPGKVKLFCFSGGEPTLHPDITELLEFIHINGHRTLMTTNGSAKQDKWKQIAPLISDIQMSAHFESLNDQLFLENVDVSLKELIKSKGRKSLDVKLMTPPGEIERSLKMKSNIEKLESLKEIQQASYEGFIGVTLVPLRGIDNSEQLLDYTEEELKAF